MYVCVQGLNFIVGESWESMKPRVIGKGCGCSVVRMKSVVLRVPLDWENLDLLSQDKARA